MGGVITRQSTQHSNMFSESEEDLSDYGGNKSPDSTSNILTKRRRLMSEERSRSSTPVFSPQANSPQRDPSSDRDSENGNKHGISKQNQSFYRSRSASISQSRSQSRSISRSVSRSRSNSRSISPVMIQSKKNRVVQSETVETDSDDEESEKKAHPQNLGLDVSESEDEDDKSKSQAENRVSKRIAKEASNVTADSSEDEGPRRDLDDNEEAGGNDFDNMMQKKKAANRRLRRKKDIDVINDNDDAIAKMIADMRIAAKEDRDLNDMGKPAIKKMGMFKVKPINIKVTPN